MTTTTGQGLWQHLDLFCCKTLHCHPPVGEMKNHKQVAEVKPKYHNSNSLCSYSAASQSHTPQLKIADIRKDLLWCAVFLLSSVPLHPSVATETRWNGNNWAVLISVTAWWESMSVSIWWAIVRMNRQFSSSRWCRRLSEHRRMHPYASYSLLRSSGAFLLDSNEKVNFYITPETSVLQKASLVHGQHRTQRLASVLIVAYSNTGDRKASKCCVPAAAAASLGAHHFWYPQAYLLLL